MYVPEGTDITLQTNVIAKLLRNHVVRLADKKLRIKSVTSACIMSLNLLLYDGTRHTRTPPLDILMKPTEKLTSVALAPLLKQLGLGNARLMSVHEVDVRLSLGKRMPLRRL
jgi:hypothetical protein